MLLEPRFEQDYRVQKEVRSLHAAGHQICVLNPGPRGRASAEGVAVLGFDAPTGITARIHNLVAALSWRHRAWQRALEGACAELEPDAIHVHDLPLVATALAVARPRGLRVVADLHENMPYLMQLIVDQRRWVYRRLHNLARWQRHERAVLAEVDAVICVVEEARARLEREAGVARERICIVANYDERRAVAPLSDDPSRPFTLGYVGVMNGHRGLAFLIEALPELRAALPSLRLSLAGDGHERAALEARVAELDCCSEVEFHGWLPVDELHPRMARDHAGLILHDSNPLTEATIPNKLFGYMAMGRPVIVTDCGPLERVVRDARCGLVVPCGDRAALLDAAQRLADPELRRELGNNGRRALEDRYNWGRASAELCALYERLATSANRSPK
jgi:glycosyltransferase involved in cell wall biosynthesis